MNDSSSIPSHVQFILFGAGGDLSWRMIVPALFKLHTEGGLPEHFELIAVDRKAKRDVLAKRLHSGVQQFGDARAGGKDAWPKFLEKLSVFNMDLRDHEAYAALHKQLHAGNSEKSIVRIFYCAIPPELLESITEGLASTGLAQDRAHTRIVIEKPIGHDLASFNALDAAISQHFHEQQVFRMDHFLGEETVQNILALRFANPIFEPIWNRRYIDHVVITAAETLGVEDRAGYYESAGALRDMMQNHLLQLFCLVAMEPPARYNADDLRNRKLEALQTCRPIPVAAVAEYAVRGQYGAGWIRGDHIAAYRNEAGVAPESNTETYAALRLFIDNWRWQDVPFYMRTGKRMAENVSEISIRFREVPHNAFPGTAELSSQPVRLVIQIQPREGVVLKIMAKEPGLPLRLRPVDMRFCYQEVFGKSAPGAYETLLRDLWLGDATHFMRADQVRAAWELLQPVITAWDEIPATDFPNYAAGSWGPEAAERLIAAGGDAWLVPTL